LASTSYQLCEDGDAAMPLRRTVTMQHALQPCLWSSPVGCGLLGLSSYPLRVLWVIFKRPSLWAALRTVVVRPSVRFASMCRREGRRKFKFGGNIHYYILQHCFWQRWKVKVAASQGQVTRNEATVVRPVTLQRRGVLSATLHSKKFTDALF